MGKTFKDSRKFEYGYQTRYQKKQEGKKAKRAMHNLCFDYYMPTKGGK